MNRSQDDIRTIEKVKQIVRERFPGFASRYFNYNMYLKAPKSLYGYALDLTSFFDYLETIKNSFMENPDADLIIFNLHENPVTRFIIKKRMKINRLNYMRFGSVRIAFKLNSIRKKNISFDPNFGTGANVSFGEDTIFLHDCLKAHLKIIALPKTILSLTNQRESTWFRGFDDKYFNDKGKLFYRINKKAHLFLCLQDSIRHKKEYQLPWKKVFALELKGK